MSIPCFPSAESELEMRRDDRRYDPTEGADEIAAIEAQWTRIWEAQGGPQGHAERIKRREEFEIMWPYIERLPNGSRLLDGGCGMGDWVIWLSKTGYPTTGLDISRVTIDKLKAMFPELDFAVGDVRATGLATGCIDGYFAWGTFEHFEEGFGPVVSEAFRVLKPGGLLFMSVPFDNLRHALRATLWDGWRLPPQSETTRFYQWRLTRGELARVLAAHGFAVEDVKVIYKRHGLQRWLQQNFGLNPNATVTKGIAFVLAPFVPKALVGHMILAVARKPASVSNPTTEQHDPASAAPNSAPATTAPQSGQ
jgi:SAM-dependent methyltransferase